MMLKGLGLINAAANAVVRFMIFVYKRCISPFTPASCRFHPTCSEYARIVFLRFNFFKAFWLTLWRIFRCHPFYKGDFVDPPPENNVDNDENP